jgi:hypothetical protein
LKHLFNFIIDTQVPILLEENVLAPMVKFLSTVDPKEVPKKAAKLSEADDNHQKGALLACLDAVNRLLEEGKFKIIF